MTQAAQRELEELQRRAIKDAIAFVMSDKQGRLFVRSVMAMTGWDTSPMTGNSQTFHNLGAQAVGKKLRDQLRLNALPQWRQLEDEDFADAQAMKAARDMKD